MAKIDEDKLNTTIQQLLVKDQDLLSKHNDITLVLTALRSIQMVQKPKFDQSTGAKTKETIDTKPIDPFTNTEMDDARRLEIFNANITKAEALLNG